MDDVLMEVATNLQQQMGPILCNLHANWVGSMFDKANHAIFFYYYGCPGQLTCILTNSTDPKINNHINLQWP